jgi:hypothetical protein
MKHLYLPFLLHPISLPAQSITATMAQLGGQEIRLEGFRGMQTYPIATATADMKGRATLNYGQADRGVGYLSGPDKKPLFVLLTGEEVQLTGQSFSQTESIQVLQGFENQQFVRYATEHPRREQALSAWAYLDKLYTQDSLLAGTILPDRVSPSKKSVSATKTASLSQDCLPKAMCAGFYPPAGW